MKSADQTGFGRCGTIRGIGSRSGKRRYTLHKKRKGRAVDLWHVEVYLPVAEQKFAVLLGPDVTTLGGEQEG